MHQETTTGPQGEARSATGQPGFIALHQRICAGDTQAAEALAELLGPRLIDYVRARFPRTDPELLADSATDAILDYLAHPRRFDPARSGLDKFLRMVAWRKVRNLHRIQDRRTRHEVPTPNEVLEQWPLAGRGVNGEVEATDGEDIYPTRLEQFEGWLAGLSKRDRSVVSLMLDGECEYHRCAVALGLEHLPPEEQRTQVNLTKRRLIRAARCWLERRRRKSTPGF